MALLVATWAQPKTAGADAYPLHTVKSITDNLKPNVLVVLETAQSMQDLPGENAARYNEVGADCEDGSRNCRLNGQVGRWDFSGMGYTEAVTVDYPPSQMVVTKLDGNVSPAVIATAYNSLEPSGQIILSLDPNATAAKRICIQTTTSGTLNTFADGYKKANQTCPEANGEPLPSTARPVGTPTAVLRADGLGFQIITSWYDPAVRSNNCSSGNTFNYGKSYVTAHEFGADGTWYQLAGVAIDNAVLTGTAFIGTGLFVDGINAASTPQSININETFSSIQQSSNSTGAERYSRTSWSEQMYY